MDFWNTTEDSDNIKSPLGLPWWLSGKEYACQCKKHRFSPLSEKIPRAVEWLSLCATTTEPVLWSRSHDYWVHVPQLLKPAVSRARALQQEKPAQREACIPLVEESLCSNEDPVQSKINK